MKNRVRNKAYSLILNEEKVDMIIEKVSWKYGTSNSTFRTVEGEELTRIGKPKLVEIEITGRLSYMAKGVSPNETIERLKSLMEAKMPVSFDLYGSQYSLILPRNVRYVSIEYFNCAESAEIGGDYYITLSLRQYKPLPKLQLKESPYGGYEIEEKYPAYVTNKEKENFENRTRAKLKVTQNQKTYFLSFSQRISV